MRSGNGHGTAAALAFMLAAVAVTDLSAHRRDEYLQAARLAIAPTRVELQLDLTPGIAVAESIIADIDRDRNGVLSPDEKQAYVGRVLNAIVLEVDGHAVDMQPAAGAGASSFPDIEAFRRGEGTIALRSSAALPSLSNGEHHLAYRNTHRRDVSVYLANALMPDSDRIAIDAQQRDSDQRDLTIDYELRDAPAFSFARAWLMISVAGAALWAGLLARSARSSSVMPIRACSRNR